MHRGRRTSCGGQRSPRGPAVFFSLCFIGVFFFLQFAIQNRWRRSKYDPDRKHWLDWAEEKYSVSRLVGAGVTPPL